MRHHPLLRLIAASSLGTLAAGSAAAQDSYSYLGAGIGRSQVGIDDAAIGRSLAGSGLTATAIGRDERDTAYKLFGGYQFNRNFALELGYFDLGKFGFAVTTSPPGAFATTMAARGVNLDLVGTLPLAGAWSMLVRGGVQYAKTRDTWAGSAGAISLQGSDSRRKANAKFGLGLQVDFSQRAILRGEVERYRINDAAGGHGRVNVASLSLLFPFGRSGPAAPMAALPAYVSPSMATAAPQLQPAPAPAPTMVVQAPAPREAPPQSPAPPAMRRVSLSAESLFGFDHAELRADGKAALDSFTAEAAGLRVDSLSVEGHTDRLGSTAYNQTLSTKRAEIVKAYLVSTGRFEAGQLSARGHGESQPVTRPGECKGSAATATLIACLQPDRRVDVALSGSR